MPRWDPNGRDRLVRAALELISDQGYEPTTVAQIAERAGLTKSTFFRHFSDKREALFAGDDVLRGLMAAGIASAPESGTPIEAVRAGLAAVEEAFTPERRDLGPQLQAAIAANPELQERLALKRAGYAQAMREALLERGVPEAIASVGSSLGLLAFSRAYQRWSDPKCNASFSDVASATLDELAAAGAALAAGGELPAARHAPNRSRQPAQKARRR